jgi:DNA modification methylase
VSVLVLRGDARALPLPDASVDLICTSPPYFSLRSYTDGGEHYQGQIGSEPTPAEYVDSLIDCTREWMRVLKPSGSLWVNLGDKYAGNTGNMPAHTQSVAGRSLNQVLGRREGRPERVGGHVPTKSLIGLPWRYALRCIDDLGLILRAEVIWAKPNGLPESVTDRVRRSHEQWFWLSTWAPEGPPPDLVRAVLEQVAAGILTVDEAERLLTTDITSHEVWFHATKQPRYFSAVDEIREQHAEPNGRPGYGRERPPAPGGNRGPHVGRLSHAAHRDMGQSALGKLPGSVWEIPSEPLQVPDYLGVDHFAAFPTEWPRRIILGWSPSGICTACEEGRRPIITATHARPAGDWNPSRKVENRPVGLARPSFSGHITGEACACPDTTAPTQPAVVVDPFGGTGTTALVAAALGRHGVSVDRSADYCRLAAWRTTDRGEIAKAMRVPKPPRPVDGQEVLDLFA